jgi:hypothetical protein
MARLRGASTLKLFDPTLGFGSSLKPYSARESPHARSGTFGARDGRLYARQVIWALQGHVEGG